MSAVLNGVYINGAWRAGLASLEVINPATEAVLAHVSVGDASTVTQAVDAASAAFIDWSKSTGRDRAALLRKIAQGVSEQREQLMHLQSSNNGKPLFEAAIDVDDVIATFDYYASVAEAMDASQDSPVALPNADFSARLRREPCGVVGLIVPWNFPMVTTSESGTTQRSRPSKANSRPSTADNTEIDNHHTFARLCQQTGQGDGCGGLADPTFLIGYCPDWLCLTGPSAGTHK